MVGDYTIIDQNDNTRTVSHTVVVTLALNLVLRERFHLKWLAQAKTVMVFIFH